MLGRPLGILGVSAAPAAVVLDKIRGKREQPPSPPADYFFFTQKRMLDHGTVTLAYDSWLFSRVH